MKTPFDHVDALIRAYLKEERNADGAWERFAPVYDQLEAQRKAEASADAAPETSAQTAPSLPTEVLPLDALPGYSRNVATFTKPGTETGDSQFKEPDAEEAERRPWEQEGAPFPFPPDGDNDLDPHRRRK